MEKRVVEKNPQPRGKLSLAPRKFEILHHPFDLRFRGRVNKWLNALGDLELDSVLDIEGVRTLRMYFYPQGKSKVWLNQDVILEKIGIKYKKKLKESLVSSLLGIWEELKT